MARRPVLSRLAAALIPLAVTASVLVAAPATAVAPSAPAPVVEPGAPGATTEATIVELRHTSGLFGGTVPTATATTPYPTSGLQDQRSVTTAQIVLEDPDGSSTRIETYCIDLDTETTLGIHYRLGDWTAANVPNLEYVQWILENNYPENPGQPVAGSRADQVRAVQGAIWFFTDRFVVSRFYPAERNAVRAIVEAAQRAVGGVDNGPAPAPVPAPQPADPPQPPVLTVTPATATAVPGELTGPYTVARKGVEDAPLRIRPGTEVFADAAATEPVADGTDVADGDRFWVRFAAGAVDPGFTIDGEAEVRAGNVYLYDGNNPPRTRAQKLVLAADTIVPVRAGLAITPAATGALQVDLTIGGAAAGDQGQIDLEVACVDGTWSLSRPLSRVANAPAGRATLGTVTGIPVGAVCEVSQTDSGANAYAVLASTNAPLTGIPIVAGDPVIAEVQDAYAAPAPTVGTVRVDVQIGGAAAGRQSALALVATCTSGADRVVRDIPVPAGVTGRSTVAVLADLPVGAECSVAQPVDGRNADARFDAAASSIQPDPVTVVAGADRTILVSDVYAVPAPAVGTLEVDATIVGDAAGRQSAIELTAACTLDGDVRRIPVSVPAGATGTNRVATVADVEADSTCVLVQRVDGANDRASLSSSAIAPASATIRDGAASLLTLSNAYAAAAPTPTPTPTATPTHGALPATGSAPAPPWTAGIAALIAGAAVLGLDALRRRRA